MPDASPSDPSVENLPTPLPYPISVNFRNSDLGIDESAKASRLNEVGMLATMKSAVPPGTVLFSAVDMKAINATARGLARVVWQRPLEDGIGIETLLDFIELSDDAKGKISKLLSGNVGPMFTSAPRTSARRRHGWTCPSRPPSGRISSLRRCANKRTPRARRASGNHWA